MVFKAFGAGPRYTPQAYVVYVGAIPAELAARLGRGIFIKMGSVLDRLLRAIAGLFIGALLGMLALYFLMLLTGFNFGLDNVRPGAVLGAVVGFSWDVRRS